MKNRSIWLGMQVVIFVFGMMVIGCGSEEINNSGGDEYVPPVKDPLTGTVTITSDVDIYIGKETMTLTADISDLDVGTTGNSYQWKRNNVNISGASKSTYEVTSDDIGKKISVHVTNWEFSGEKSGEYTVPVPTTLNLTLKWNAAAQKKDTGITIEKENGSYWGSTSGNLTTTGTTIILTSWIETKFKIRTTYTFIELKYYFKKDNASGSELYDFSNDSKSFVLTNSFQTSVLYDLFATEE